ncbi:CoxG family protein [Alkalicoccus saliphilus]|jgi:uncharacterized protein|uniref:Carbon monoxide dehydrogenase n=1 Tax=Alkalicoccus saliphilus TaxID=200989 RepID=A0A2T4U3P6_9BACI|nr:carbon monoxide dehydrogenase subunit G [Alkalicoccus saliphilus]PTL38020.1 carbon monoxide dehydrogenase [Alkalicoccus saliphilus]
MNGKGKIKLPGPREEVFESLFDPELLEESITGCRELVQLEDHKYRAELEIGIAGVRGKYSVILTMDETAPPHYCRMIVYGEGSPGTVDAEAEMKLSSHNEETTMLMYTYEAELGGKVASLNKTVLQGAAKVIISDFFRRSKKEIKKEQKENS